MDITITEANNTALLVGLNTENTDFDKYMEELDNLAEACEFEVIGKLVQSLPHPTPNLYLGSGKVDEISELVTNMEIGVCIFEDTLSPVQLKNLSKRIPCKIMDRTGLILEIFEKRARTREAKLQVESARLQYMLPRLIGMWEAIGRQGGTSGSKSSKGIGETQLELDRRWIQKRIIELNRELTRIEHDRDVQRRKREKGNLPLVALVGYTNAGKSTIMNRLLEYCNNDSAEKTVFEKDMLFATLDTQVRRISTPNNKDFLLSDTVGFLEKLPHGLIKAFRSTLEEIKYADLLIEVVDLADENHEAQMAVTRETLKELSADTLPIIHVMNKCDRTGELIPYPKINDDKIYISAATGRGINELIEYIQSIIYKDNEKNSYLIPYSKGNIVNEINENAEVLTLEYREDGVFITANVPKYLAGKYKDCLTQQ